MKRSSLMRSLRTIEQPLRTALAGALAVAAYKALRLPHGYWAVISAIIVMQSNLGRSVRASTERVLGTAVGAAIGSVVLWAGGSHAWTLGLAIAVTMWICGELGLQASMRLAGVTVAIVMLIVEGSAWNTGISRFLDVVLGVLVALVVSVAWPARARRQLRESLAQAFEEFRDLASRIAGAAFEGATDEPVIEAARVKTLQRGRRNAELIRDLRREPARDTPVLLLLTESAERIRGHLFAIDNAARQMAGDSAAHVVEAEMRALFAAVESALETICADLAGRAAGIMQDVDAPLQALEAKLAQLRQSGASLTYDAEQMLRLYALVYRLRQLAPEIARSADFANASGG